MATTTFSQANRPFGVSTPLGADVLLFWKMRGQEELGRLSSFALEMLSDDPTLKPIDLLGKPVTVRIDLADSAKRYFHGYVTQFAATGTHGNLAVYHAAVQPWPWFLSRTADCRIFQQKNVPDIVKQVFRDAGFTDFEDKLSGTYQQLEYCVQYRETTFNFVSRLLESEGIYYYFTHVDGKHNLILADDIGAHATTSGYESVPYFPPLSSFRRERDHLSAWTLSQQVESGNYELNDFDFENPSTKLTSRSTISRSHPFSSWEVYDYPGGYFKTADGNRYVASRLTELQAQHEQVQGRGNVRGLSAGALFALTGFDRAEQDRDYLVTAATYRAQDNAYESTRAATEVEFECSISAIPKTQSFRPVRLARKPFVQGPQTAIVVGKSGEEIWTDKYGRVKVQFHWDRKGTNDENSSCWVRVAQVWAGKNWGAMHVPRIGQEVIVDFLEGDPDRPIITGRVYNAEQMPPYALPDNQTQSGLKSRSSKQGDTTTFNELRFEDKKGEEEIYFHAEKNFTRIVENNDVLKVGLDKKDKGDQTITIHNNQTLTVGNSQSDDGSQTIEIWKNRTETVKEGNEKITISKGNRDVIVSKGNDTHKVETGNRDVIVSKGNDTHKVETGNREVVISKGNDTLTVSTGNLTIDVSAGKATVTAAQSIELKVGGSSIKIEPAKITIKAPQIAIQGDAQLEAKSPMTTVSGDGTLTLKGGIVQIN